jgi:DNA replication and repair protein RecF
VIRIERLRISGLRNLSTVDIHLPAQTVWFHGSNGAGKTSLLEAVYLLSRGASFRGRRFGALTMQGAAGTKIEAWLSDGCENWHRRLCFSPRTTKESIGEGFDVRLVGASMHSLLEGEPELRRRFIDWNVFHVEPSFSAIRARFRRISAQRNAWLRDGGLGLAVWDGDYVSALCEIDRLRTQLFDALCAAFQELAADFGSMAGLVPQWRSGLPDASELPQWLANHREADVARGYSFLSPARSDFYFSRDGTSWVGSRGQNKLAGVLLQLAADRVITNQVGRKAIWLVDDLGAELDAETYQQTLNLITSAAGQVLITCLDPAVPALFHGNSIALFHVEQGNLCAERP